VRRVWEIVTDARHVAGRIVLAWKEHGSFLGVVERVQPPEVFAFRGAYEPDTEPAPGNSTLVEFTLSPEGDGTRLRVLESGFASLAAPDEQRARNYEDNVGGWREMLGRASEYAERVAA